MGKPLPDGAVYASVIYNSGVAAGVAKKQTATLNHSACMAPPRRQPALLAKATEDRLTEDGSPYPLIGFLNIRVDPPHPR